MGLTKEQKAQRVVQDASVLLLWYTAWLALNAGPLNADGTTDFNPIVDRFLAEDEEMVRRFLNLPQKGE